MKSRLRVSLGCLGLAGLLLVGCDQRLVDEQENSPDEPASTSTAPVETRIAEIEIAADRERLEKMFHEGVEPLLEEPHSTETPSLEPKPSESRDPVEQRIDG